MRPPHPTAMTETRFIADAEIRADTGRVITGVAVRYGSRAKLPWGVYERIEPRAFDPIGDATANVMHQRSRLLARTGGGGLDFDDAADSLRFTIDLPETREADDALELVRKNVLRGASIEFLARKEAQEGNLRIIQRGRLLGVALVDSPAYPDSVVKAMRARYAALEPPKGVCQRRRFWL